MKGLTPFRKKVLKAWQELGVYATSSEVADEIHANETRVSSAMAWIESKGMTPQFARLDT